MNRCTVDLNQALTRPECPKCKVARIRPTLRNTSELNFSCSNLKCTWRGRALLPPIKKTIIYLDTSTISHIARAMKKNDKSSPWILLYEALRKAAAAEVICCPGSSVISDEIELADSFDQIRTISHTLGEPTLNHQLDIQRAQMLRALERFMNSSQVTLETNLPLEDAFADNPHEWGPEFNIHMNTKPIPSLVSGRRAGKLNTPKILNGIYKRYEDSGYTFEQIRIEEAKSFGRATLEEAMNCARKRQEGVPLTIESWGIYIPNEVEEMTNLLVYERSMDQALATKTAIGFFLSEHCCNIPTNDISSRLHATLAIRSRGPKGRKPDDGDKFDIEHIANFMPYCDVFIVDSFFNDVCTQLDLGKKYGTRIQNLGVKDIPDFISMLDQLTKNAPQTDLSNRIMIAVQEGGYLEERAKILEARLRAQGIKFPSDGSNLAST